MPPKKPKRGRPFTGGREPIRGQMRWGDAEWAEVQAALAKESRSYAEVARELLLRWARRVNRG